MTRAIAAVLAISMAILCAGGCQEEQASSGDKMARLMAVENKDLKAQLQAEKKKKDDEIKNLNTQLTKLHAEIAKKDAEISNISEPFKKTEESLWAEITRRGEETKQLVEQCQTEMKQRDNDLRIIREQLGQCTQARNDKVQEEADNQCKGAVSALDDWNSELKEEVERLKAELAKVKGEEKK